MRNINGCRRIFLMNKSVKNAVRFYQSKLLSSSIAFKNTTNTNSTTTTSSSIPKAKAIEPAEEQQDCLIDIVKSKCPDVLSQFSREIEEDYARRRTKFADLLEKRRRLIKLVERKLCNDLSFADAGDDCDTEAGNARETVDSTARLYPVGSFCTELATNSSDIDLSWVFPQTAQAKIFLSNHRRNSASLKDFLWRRLKQLQADEQLGDKIEQSSSKSYCISTSRVPLMKIAFKTGLVLDIQMHNTFSIRNSNMIRFYVKADDRLGQLNLWAQHWLNRMGAKGAADEKLSSYHILLLVIHFLQTLRPDPILPVLARSHRHLVGADLRLRDILHFMNTGLPRLPDLQWRSRNGAAVGELAVQFIDYYYRVDLEQMAVCIGEGVLKSRDYLDGGHNGRIYLKDPFETHSVCRGKKTIEVFESALDGAFRALLASKKTAPKTKTFLNYPLTNRHLQLVTAENKLKNVILN